MKTQELQGASPPLTPTKALPWTRKIVQRILNLTILIPELCTVVVFLYNGVK